MVTPNANNCHQANLEFSEWLANKKSGISQKPIKSFRSWNR